jgi:hypothetical protein
MNDSDKVRAILEELAQDCYDLGADHFLTNPDYVDTALTAIMDMLRTAREDQIELDFLTYNVELDNDESELIKIRDMLQAELQATEKGAKS